MFRSLLSCASIFVLLTSNLLAPESAFAKRCGEKAPETLLSLYRSSQFIYVGTFDRVEEGEITEDTTEYSVVPIKKSFSLSTALKGETKKMLVLEEDEYRYKGREIVEEEEVEPQSAGTEEAVVEAAEPAESEAAQAESEESEADDTELKPGDRVLLFLNKNDDNGALELADYRDGLKKMTTERLAAYEPRIRELNDIFSKSEPSYSELVAWIVRCAEDPETRWEGTYELQRSFQYMQWNIERAKLAQQKSQTEEGEIDAERYLPQPPKKFDTGDENFAKELTEGQKLLLTNTLLNRPHPKSKAGNTGEDSAGMIRGDRELIELVRRWGDSKVARNILDQIRLDSSDPDLNADLMESVASILGDDELTKVAEQYSEIRWRNDDDEPEADNGEQESDAVDKDNLTIAVDTSDENVGVPDEEFTDSPDQAGAGTSAIKPKNEPKKKTYGDVRTELLKTFLERADRIIAKRQKAER